jgi:hypothetical protein
MNKEGLGKKWLCSVLMHLSGGTVKEFGPVCRSRFKDRTS